jgi:hypothetical protein
VFRGEWGWVSECVSVFFVSFFATAVRAFWSLYVQTEAEGRYLFLAESPFLSPVFLYVFVVCMLVFAQCKWQICVYVCVGVDCEI